MPADIRVWAVPLHMISPGTRGLGNQEDFYGRQSNIGESNRRNLGKQLSGWPTIDARRLVTINAESHDPGRSHVKCVRYYKATSRTYLPIPTWGFVVNAVSKTPALETVLTTNPQLIFYNKKSSWLCLHHQRSRQWL